MSAQPHLQSYHVAPTLQFRLLSSDLVNLRKLSLVADDFGLQSAVTDATYCVTDVVHCWKLWFQHTHRLISEHIDRLGAGVRCCV